MQKAGDLKEWEGGAAGCFGRFRHPQWVTGYDCGGRALQYRSAYRREVCCAEWCGMECRKMLLGATQQRPPGLALQPAVAWGSARTLGGYIPCASERLRLSLRLLGQVRKNNASEMGWVRTRLYEVDPIMRDLRVGHAAWPLWSAAAVPRVRNLSGQW